MHGTWREPRKWTRRSAERAEGKQDGPCPTIDNIKSVAFAVLETP